MKKKSRKRKAIYAFIDSQNLSLGVKSLGWNLDFAKFRVYLRDKYKVEKAYLFIGHVPGNEKLYTHLQESGYVVVFKPTLEYRKGKKVFTKGNVDAELVLHTMINLKTFHKAIIVSGDGDFHCLVEYLHSQKKLEKIIVPNSKYSSLLRKFAQYIVPVELFKSKVKETRTSRQ